MKKRKPNHAQRKGLNATVKRWLRIVIKKRATIVAAIHAVVWTTKIIKLIQKKDE